mgnify:CR=1 FL=1
MPYVETVEELAERIAEMLGIYNQGRKFVGMTPVESRAQTDWSADHAEDCQCRTCWCGAMERRIRGAVAHDNINCTSGTPLLDSWCSIL